MGLFSWTKKLFKKKQKETSAKIQGQPLAVNLPARSRERQDRNLARMKICRERMALLERNGMGGTREYMLFKNEYERRRLAMEQMELTQGR